MPRAVATYPHSRPLFSVAVHDLLRMFSPNVLPCRHSFVVLSVKAGAFVYPRFPCVSQSPCYGVGRGSLGCYWSSHVSTYHAPIMANACVTTTRVIYGVCLLGVLFRLVRRRMSTCRLGRLGRVLFACF